MSDPSAGGFAPDEPTPRKSAKANPTGWRDDAAAKPTSKAALVVLTLFAIVGIGGAIVALLRQPDPPSDPLFVAVPFGEYDPPWAAPPSVYRDAALLTESFPLRGGRPTPEQTFTFQEKDKFEILLADLKDGRGLFEGLAGRPLVLSIAGLAAVHDKTVYLVPARARHGDPASWVPVSAILDTVAAAKATKKFVILDLAYPTADPYGGTLRDDAAARLDQLLAEREGAKQLPFVVLTSTSLGELSLPVRPLRYSGFAFYLAEGLRGAADGYRGDGPSLADLDKTVTVGELCQFVRHRVERWARVAHDRAQTPKNYGLTKDTDFMLSDAKLDPVADPAGPVTYPDALKAGWEDRTASQGRGEYRPFPVEFARLTDGLLRAEREWLGSGDADRTQRAWDLTRKDWDRRVRDSGGRDPAADAYRDALAAVASHRLAVDLRVKTAPPPAYVPLREMMREYASVSELVPPLTLEKEKELEKARANAKEKAKAWEDAVKDADTRMRMFWDVIAEGNSPSAGLAKYWRSEFASEKVSDRLRGTSEVVLVTALTETDLTYIPNKRVLPEYPQLGVAALLKSEAALSELFATGPNGFALVASRVREGEQLRARGQTELFTGTREQAESAHGPLTDAAKRFQEARADLLRWQEATKTAETATATLIDAVPGELIGTQAEFDRWLSATEKAAQMADLLSAARTAGRFRADQVPPTLVNEVRRAADDIRASFVTPKDDAEPTAGLGGTRAKPGDLQPLERLVAATLVSPARRKAVWEALQTDAARFHASAREDDGTDAANQTQTRNAAPARLGDRPTADELALRRGQASVALLRLAGHPRAAEVATLVEPLVRAANSAEAARALGDELRMAWKNLPATMRAARVTPPDLSPYRPAATPAETPGLVEARADVAAYLAATRAVLEADRPLRGNTAAGKKFYPDALRGVPAQ